MKKILCVFFILLSFSVYSQQNYGGSYSAYLAGSFVNMDNVFTNFTVINPTSEKFEVMICFFKIDGTFISGFKKEIKSNGSINFDSLKIGEKTGVVKIISPIGAGIVGYQKNIYKKGNTVTLLTESNLASIPDMTVIEREYKILLSHLQ